MIFRLRLQIITDLSRWRLRASYQSTPPMTEPYEYWLPLCGSVIGMMAIWLALRASESPSIRFCAPSRFASLSSLPPERQSLIVTSAARRFYRSLFGFIPCLLAGLLFPSGYLLYF